MKQNWQPPIVEIIGIDKNAQDVLTSSPAEVGIDYGAIWGEEFNGGNN